MLPVLARSFFVRDCALLDGEQPDTVDEAVLPRPRPPRDAMRYPNDPQERVAPAGFLLSMRGSALERLGPGLGRMEHAQDLDHLALDAVRHDTERRTRKEFARAHGVLSFMRWRSSFRWGLCLSPP